MKSRTIGIHQALDSVLLHRGYLLSRAFQKAPHQALTGRTWQWSGLRGRPAMKFIFYGISNAADFYGPTQRLGTVSRVNKWGEATAEDG